MKVRRADSPRPGGGVSGGELIELPPQNQYASMIKAFAGHIASGKPWNNLSQSAAVIGVLDRIREAAGRT